MAMNGPLLTAEQHLFTEAEAGTVKAFLRDNFRQPRRNETNTVEVTRGKYLTAG